jgi:hypothetical protein
MAVSLAPITDIPALTRDGEVLPGAAIHYGRWGWEERRYYAEALRVKGRLLSLNGDPAGAERAYIAALEWARQQQTKSWELRAAASSIRFSNVSGSRR